MYYTTVQYKLYLLNRLSLRIEFLFIFTKEFKKSKLYQLNSVRQTYTRTYTHRRTYLV